MPRLSMLGIAAVVFVFAAATPARAQLAPADAGDFMGAWTLVVDSPQGPLEQPPVTRSLASASAQRAASHQLASRWMAKWKTI